MVWRWLFNSDFGLIEQCVQLTCKMGIRSQDCSIFYCCYRCLVYSGYNMVLFISGLQEIPHDYYEAAEIDGATGVKSSSI